MDNLLQNTFTYIRILHFNMPTHCTTGTQQPLQHKVTCG